MTEHSSAASEVRAAASLVVVAIICYRVCVADAAVCEQ
jgi:hypothetical protein